MTVDFSYEVYDQLIRAARDSGYRTLSVRDYLTADDLSEPFVVLRHDVDRKPERALDMARIEAAAGCTSSYYFRAIEKTYRPDIFTAIADLGHEVGYHYEDLDTADGDVEAAHESFARNLARFREHVDVDTIAMHGNPLTPHDNRDMWQGHDFAEYDLLGEVYLSVDFSDVVYFTDTNRTWVDEKTMVNDWPVGPSAKAVEVDTTEALVALVESRQFDRLYVLTHPNRWTNSYTDWVVELGKDTAINAGKWGLWAARSARSVLDDTAVSRRFG